MKRNTTTQVMPLVYIYSYTKLIFVSNGIMRIFFFVTHEKKGRCFSPKLKNGTYEDFMHRKEIYYINVNTNT
jgi:hypothetical protein